MKFSKLIAATLAATAISGALNANASSITYDTRAITDYTFLSTNDYQLGWGQQASAVSSSSLSEFNGPVPGFYSFSHLNVDFNVNSFTNVIFQFGIDAGYGGEVRLDGSGLLARNVNDMWWAFDWGNAGGILNVPLGLSAGHHVLESFWAEACCSGGQAGRFSVDNGVHWQDLSVTNLNALAASQVPEPGILTLLGVGLAGLGLGRRKKEEGKAA